MNTTNIFKQFTKNTVGKFTRIKFTKNGTIRKGRQPVVTEQKQL